MNNEEQIKALELELCDTGTRNTPDRLNIILSNNFEEIGSSGNIHNKQNILGMFAQQNSINYELSDYSFVHLADDCILVKYKCTSTSSNTLRASIWVKNNDHWQLLHHQATIVRQNL